MIKSCYLRAFLMDADVRSTEISMAQMLPFPSLLGGPQHTSIDFASICYYFDSVFIMLGNYIYIVVSTGGGNSRSRSFFHVYFRFHTTGMWWSF